MKTPRFNNTNNGHPFLDNLSLVMYDLDGTLVESVPDLAIALDKTLLDMGMPAAGSPKPAYGLTSAVNYLGDNCPVSDVYGFCSGLYSYAANQEVYPLNQQILDRYVSQESGKKLKAQENPANVDPGLLPEPKD
ncbi:hypothetical protein [Endozoicomonas sp. SESOKO1]|uniref:hypothetical protein n=1 Tax=Endozoicomonas sp. SESOKO1 TaxID=2828742 RepID=UPI002147E3E5|nr:hypothetical protein [Endozoicomonas sp. SESOKO1]